MFSFTCSFVNLNIFELKKKFNSRTVVQLPEHAGFALLRCQPRGSCGAAARSHPPGEGESFYKHLRYIYGICGITKHPVREQVMAFPSHFCRGIPPSVIAIPSHYSGHVLPLSRRAKSSLPFPWVNLCLLQGPGMHRAAQNQIPMHFGLPKRGICGRCTGEHSRRDGAKLQEQQNPSWSIFL